MEQTERFLPNRQYTNTKNIRGQESLTVQSVKPSAEAETKRLSKVTVQR